MNKLLSISVMLIFFVFSHTSAQSSSEQSDMQQRYAYCLRLMGDEQYQLAVSGLRKLLQDYPQFHLPYRKIAEAYIYMEDLESGISYFEELQEKNPENPYIYYGLARIDFQNNEFENAIQRLQKCISLDPYFVEAYGPNKGLPEIYKSARDLDAGVKYFSELLKEFPRNPYVYYGLGRIYAKKGLLDEALKMYRHSIEIDSTLIYAYRASLLIHSVKSEYDKALSNAQKLLRFAKAENDLEMVAYALLRIGGFYFLAGSFERSLAYFTQSAEIAAKIGDKGTEGKALTNFGVVHATVGNKEKALEYFSQAIDLLRKTKSFRTEIRTIYNIGLIHKDLEHYQDTFWFLNRALSRAEEHRFKMEQGLILTGLAETHEKLGEMNKALMKYKKAQQIASEAGVEAEQGYILKKMGDLYYKISDYDIAKTYHERALEIGNRTRDAQILWEANTGLGTVLQKTGDAKKATYHYAKAIAIYDSIRKDLNIGTLASGFLEDKYEVYPSIISLLAQEQQLGEAFDYAEKYKARTLMKVLAKGQLSISEFLPDSVRFSLIEVRNKLEDAHFEYSQELSRAEPDKERILDLDQKITSLELKKSSIIKSVRENFYPYFQITSSEPVSLSQLQDEILEPKQLLIEFIVGSGQTSVFAIGTDTIAYYNIPVSRDELRKMLLELSNVFQSLTSMGGKGTDYIISPEQADFSILPAFSTYNVLIKPVESLINKAEDLIVVPDDFLYYLPFEVLVTDTSDIQNRYDFENAKFLIEKLNISYLQSASLLDPSLQRDRKPSRVLIAFGNPTFENAPAVTENSQSSDITAMRKNAAFMPLPNSEKEVKNIGGLFGDSNRVYMGDDASEKIFKEDASDYQIIHLASHFEVNDYDPMYSKVIFSQTGESSEDGYLQTYEIFNMHLNADLVVLSACNTALGKLSKGEGIIGISRAFLYAGAPSMLVSLWNVEDEAASLIMTNFYKHIKQGFSKNKALRLAKLDYIKNVPYAKKDPFYWAPFVLIGNLDPISIQNESINFDIILIGALVIIGISIAVVIISGKRANHNPK